jgi:transposase
MANKHYPQQFKADAVALYRSRPGAMIAPIADDLGVNRETLRSWVRIDDQRRTGPGGPVLRLRRRVTTTIADHAARRRA